MLVDGNCTAQTSTAFLRQLRANHSQPLILIWDNSPAHRGPEIRQYLTTPNLRLRLVALPAYSPDFNPDEAIWDWAREEVTANICFGTAAQVQEKIDRFFAGLTERTAEVQSRCRTTLQAQADALMTAAQELFGQMNHVDSTLALV
jgi:transposase